MGFVIPPLVASRVWVSPGKADKELVRVAEDMGVEASTLRHKIAELRHAAADGICVMISAIWRSLVAACGGARVDNAPPLDDLKNSNFVRLLDVRRCARARRVWPCFRFTCVQHTLTLL